MVTSVLRVSKGGEGGGEKRGEVSKFWIPIHYDVRNKKIINFIQIKISHPILTQWSTIVTTTVNNPFIPSEYNSTFFLVGRYHINTAIYY